MKSNIKISRMDDIAAEEKAALEYPHRVVHQISEVLVDRNSDESGPVKWDEVNEAWFFDGVSELHFFRTEEGGLACVKAEEPADAEHVVKHTYEIANAAAGGRKDKKVLEVREYLDFDEDGQCFVVYTRLADIRSGV